MQIEASSSAAALELACFSVQGRLYGIDVMQIREIVRSRPVTPLPGAPALIEGVVDLRGSVVPVVDLGRALGGPEVAEDGATRIAVVHLDDMVFGLRVDRAVDVLSVEAERVEGTPALAIQAGYDTVRAVVRRGEEAPVLVLSVEQLLERVYRSALSARSDS